MKILEKIRFGVWAMHPMSAEAYMPIVAQLLRGDMRLNTEGVSKETKVEEVTYAFEDGTTAEWYREFASSEKNGVAVYDIQGAITKNDQYCGPSGTVTLMRQMRSLDKNPNITGHLLNIDSGGGEATNISEVARFIRSDIQKPVVAHFNGLMCSAAYGIGCAADEITATLNTDIVGSIGVMMTLVDWKAYFEKQGLTIHDIYADQSTNKNGEFYAAMEGNFEPLKTSLLNPFAESFIASVKTMRPGTAQFSEVFTGKTYLAQDAVSNGLIDGIRTYEDSVKRVFEMSKKRGAAIQNQNQIFQNQNNTQMEIKLFGKTIIATKADDGTVTMSAEQFGILEAASQTATDNSTAIAELNAKVDKLQAWADATPAAAPATPTQGAPVPTQATAVDQLNSIFAQMAGQKPA